MRVAVAIFGFTPSDFEQHAAEYGGAEAPVMCRPPSSPGRFTSLLEEDAARPSPVTRQHSSILKVLTLEMLYQKNWKVVAHGAGAGLRDIRNLISVSRVLFNGCRNRRLFWLRLADVPR